MEAAEIKTMIENGVPDDLAYLLWQAESDVVSEAKRLRELAENISRKLDGVVEALDRDGTINSLGELQGRALDFDQSCALLAAKRSHRDGLRHVVGRIVEKTAAQATAEDELSGFGSSDGAGR